MRSSLVSFIFAGAVLLTLNGCAAMQQDYENRVCNYNGAYESGANDARQKQPMNGAGLASNCPAEVRDKVMEGYRTGFASVPQITPTTIIQVPVQQPRVAQPMPRQPIIIINPGDVVNGRRTYPSENPTAPSFGAGVPRSAPSQPQECLESYGRRVCGYGCKEAYGQIRCARQPGHRCMDYYGKIYCGMNCRADAGKVVCDEWD